MLSRGGRVLVLLALVAVALTGVPVSAMRQRPTPGPTGDAQVVVVAGKQLVHTVRSIWGNWQQVDRVGPFGHITGLTATYHLGEENVFFHTTDDGGELVHLVRHGDGTWETGASTPTAPYATPTGLAATDVAGTLALVCNNEHGPQLSMQGVDGAWSPWMTVPTDGRVTSVSATASGTMLRVVELAADGRSVDVRDRAADGRWSDDAHTEIAATATEIAAAQVDGELQVAAVGADGGVFHGLLTEDGSWRGFAPLGNAADAVHAAITSWMNDLQLVYTTRDGKLYHTLRLHNGSWQPWGDVEKQVGTVDAGALAIAADPLS